MHGLWDKLKRLKVPLRKIGHRSGDINVSGMLQSPFVGHILYSKTATH